MYGMKKGELCVVPHDLAWKRDFLAEKVRLFAAVNDPSVRIEHVGSTAIPTVHAKPILDIAVLCGDGGLEAVTDAIIRLGYKYRGQYDEKPGHYYAVLDRDGVRLCQIHIYTGANADWNSKLMFRDVLSSDLKLAREYSDYKVELAKTASSKAEYAAIKTRWVDTFTEKVIRSANAQ